MLECSQKLKRAIGIIPHHFTNQTQLTLLVRFVGNQPSHSLATCRVKQLRHILAKQLGACQFVVGR